MQLLSIWSVVDVLLYSLVHCPLVVLETLPFVSSELEAMASHAWKIQETYSHELKNIPRHRLSISHQLKNILLKSP